MNERALRSASSIALLLGFAACGAPSPPPSQAAAQNAPPAPPLTAPADPAQPPAATTPAAQGWTVKPRVPLPPAPPAAAAEGTGAAALAAASSASLSAPASSPTPAPAPAPVAADELQRKRAEWQEHLRMTEQAQAEMEAWQRSRRAVEPRSVPRVGAAPRAAAEAGAPANAMTAWYRRYSARSTAVSLALSQFGMAAAANPPDLPRLRAACRDLHLASAAMLADQQALAAPVDAVATPLSTAYGELGAAADSCLAGRSNDQAAHLAAARQAMSAAGTALRPYHLAP